MDCPDANTLAAHAEGLLGHRDRGEVELHLDQCEQCRMLVSAAAEGAIGAGADRGPATPHASRERPWGAARRAGQPDAPVLAGLPGLPDLTGPGIARFEVLETLGAGGMGVVCKALDRHSGRTVALKALQSTSGRSIYRIKREFRALAELRHPNLVALYELFQEGQVWFFTMELVQGVDFVTYVRRWPSGTDGSDAGGPQDTHPASDSLRDSSPWSSTGGTDDSADRAGPRAGPLAGGTEPLRAALPQLAQGVAALHAAGKVHRDIKPSNVLVDRTGRVVILDFGMVIEQDADSLQTDEGLAGTIPYMSPEQAAELPVTAASDWYSVGVMLYEALTGQRPFQGSAVTVLKEKQRRDPARPVELNPAVDADLDELCMSLLRRSPELRPGGTELLMRLTTAWPDSCPPSSLAAATTSYGQWFVGRQKELQRLDQTWQRVSKTGEMSLALVTGPSGIGKTALVERFLSELAARSERHDHRRKPRPLILRGRCHEREAVAYRAFDQVVDDVSRYLMRLPAPELLAMVGGEAAYLAAAFPALNRIPALADCQLETTLVPDPHRRRQRAFQAFRELLRALARARPLIIHLEDLQWADRDSLELLELLAKSSQLGRILLLLASRDDNRETYTALARMVAVADDRGADQSVPSVAGAGRRLSLGPLSPEDSAELAARLLEQPGPAGNGRDELRDVVSHAEGNPFVIGELVRLLRVDRPAAPGVAGAPSRAQPGAVSGLDALIERRVQHLSGPARTVLELVCVAGEGISEAVVRHAVALGDAAFESTMAELRAELLVRALGPREVDRVEAYHDRIREEVLASLDRAAVQAHHRRLAQAVKEVVGDDVDLLARHWAAAGDAEQAQDYLWRAACAADAKLAFDRAAWLYRSALDMARDAATQAKVGRALGDALVNAGRPGEAAEAYQGAVPFVGELDQLELRQLATKQWLTGGYITEGLQAIREVAREAGVPLPATHGQALRSILLHRALLRLRGMGFTERAPAEIDPRTRIVLDILFSVGEGLLNVDALIGVDFQNRFLLEALRHGDARQIATGLAREAVGRAVVSPRLALGAQELAKHAELVARRTGDFKTIASNVGVRSALCWYSGNWSEGIRLGLEADSMLATRCVGVHFEIATTRWFLCMNLLRKGELKELSERTGRYLSEFQRLGNRYAETTFKASFNLVWLARDDLASAGAELEGLLDSWPSGLHSVQHHLLALARCNRLLYQGAAEAAYQLLAAELPKLRATRLLGASGIAADYFQHLGRAALAAAALAERQSRRNRYSTEALRCARRLAKLGVPYAAAWARLIEAAARRRSKKRFEADRLRRLDEAVAQLEMTECWAVAHAARRAKGEILGKEGGRTLMRSEDKWFKEQGVKQPERFARLLAPGFAR